MADSKIEKWQGWVQGDYIQAEILRMHLNRGILREVFEMAQEADLPPSYFWDYLRELYGTAQAVAIRRQAEVDDRVITLGKLLSEMATDAHRVTREFYCGMYSEGDDDDHWQLVANRNFDERMAGEAGGDHLDPSIPAADLGTLRSRAAVVKKFVDEHLAHSDAKRDPPGATFEDINGAIDTIGDIFGKYYEFLTASGWAMLEPTIQHNWKAVFRRAWLPEDPSQGSLPDA